jgi:N-acetylglucosamine-6-phosphate deacetylase
LTWFGGKSGEAASAGNDKDEVVGNAVTLATSNPAAFLGLGYRASLVVLDAGLHVLETWIDGERAGAL